MNEKQVKDATGDSYLVRKCSAGTAAAPLINVFGPTNFMVFDRATLDAFYKAAGELLDDQKTEVAMAVITNDAVPVA